MQCNFLLRITSVRMRKLRTCCICDECQQSLHLINKYSPFIVKSTEKEGLAPLLDVVAVVDCCCVDIAAADGEWVVMKNEYWPETTTLHDSRPRPALFTVYGFFTATLNTGDQKLKLINYKMIEKHCFTGDIELDLIKTGASASLIIMYPCTS